MAQQAAAGMRAAKRALRAQLSARRSARTAGERTRSGLRLAAAGLAAPGLSAAGCVGAFLGVGTEPDTAPLLAGLRAAGVTVLLPVVDDGPELDWSRYDGTAALDVGRFGLRHPTGPRLGPDAVGEADLLLVPALAVDVHGSRLGRGGGYYDRVLARLAGPGRRAVAAWAVVYDEEILADVPVEAHDVPVAAALTPGGHRLLTPR